MQNDILVIGNGFDLAHGLPTKYNDFMKCVKKEMWGNSGSHGDIIDEFKGILNNNGFIRYFDSYTNAVPGWIDFELLIKDIIYNIDEFCKNYKKYMAEDSDVVIENMINRKLSIILDYFDIKDGRDGILEEAYFHSIYGLNKTEIYKKLKKDLNGLIRALEIYLTVYVHMWQVERDKEELIPLQQIKDIDPSYVISFNYTDTYKIYGIDEKDVFHVHGKLGSNPNNMVLGFNDEEPDNVDYIYFKKYFQRIQKLTGYIDKEKLATMMVINEDAGCTTEEKPTIHFYGHSLDVTDKDIIDKLWDASEHFIVYIYNQEDYESKVINLIKVFDKEKATQRIQEKKIEFVQCKSDPVK